MRSIILEAPVALHFSGHGITNSRENLGNTVWAMNKDKGDVLLLEDDHGQADYYFKSELKKLIT